jgi:hypothetical protein
MPRFERSALLEKFRGMVERRERDAIVLHGASSMERLPVETALTEQTRRFKGIAFR